MSSKSIMVIASVLVVMLVAHFAPLVRTHAEQDTCAFGPVSNTEYRQLLVEAKRRSSEVWEPLVWDDDKTSALLNERQSALSAGASVYGRLASMHAVARSLGAVYMNSRIPKPYENALTERGGVIFFHYVLDVNRIGFIRPVLRQLWIPASMYGPKSPPHDWQPNVRVGDITFVAHFPYLLDGGNRNIRSHGEQCPPSPDPAIAHHFEPKAR